MTRIIEVVVDSESETPWTWMRRYDDEAGSVWINPVDFDKDGDQIVHVMVEDDDIDITWIEHYLDMEADVYSVRILEEDAA